MAINRPVPPITTERQQLIKLARVRGWWQTLTGDEVTSEAEKEHDGGQTEAEVMTGPAEVGTITLSRPFRALRDAEVLRNLRKKVGSHEDVLTRTFTDRNLVPIASPDKWNVVLVSVQGPEGNANSRTAGRLTLRLEATRVTS